MNRKRWLLLAFIFLGIGWIIVPIYLGLNERTTDLIFAVIFGVGFGTIVFEDHRLAVPKRKFLLVCGMVFAIIAMSTIGLLAAGYRYQAMFPLVVILGGTTYWYLARHSQSEDQTSN